MRRRRRRRQKVSSFPFLSLGERRKELRGWRQKVFFLMRFSVSRKKLQKSLFLNLVFSMSWALSAS